MNYHYSDISQILTRIEQFYPVSTTFKTMFAELLHFENRKQGFPLLNHREVQMTIWFIILGSARAIRKTGQEVSTHHTSWLWFESDIIINPNFYDDGPSPYDIDLLEDSYLAYLTKDDIKTLKQSGTDMNEFLSKLRSHDERLRESHYEDVITKTKKQLYDQILIEHPTIFNYVKIKDVASFLGMAPDTLYKLRRKSG